MKAATAKNSVTQSAMARLGSVYFLLDLAGQFRSVGLHGKDRLMALGVYFVVVSRFQRYPLRVQIVEQTEGTAAHIIDKVADFLLPDSMVTIKPKGPKGWERLTKTPDQKIVFIPKWTTDTENGPARFVVERDRVIRRTPFRQDRRIVDRLDEVEGRFACVSVDREDGWIHKVRWLTTTQADGEQLDEDSTSLIPLPEPDFEEWHEVDRLLQERARLQVLLPEWEQDLIEMACEKRNNSLQHIPTLLQLWRTMCLIRSFQSEENSKAEVLSATFDDLAEATLLAKKVFREASFFPSMAKLYNRLPKVANETSALNPMTGNYVKYKREIKKVTVQWENPLDGNADGI